MATRDSKGRFTKRAKRVGRKAVATVRRFGRRVRRARAKRVGLLTKGGVAVATVPPLAFAAFDGLRGFMSVKATDGSDLDLPSKLVVSGAMAINSLTKGYGLGQVYAQVPVNNILGQGVQRYAFLPDSTPPPGSHVQLAVAGTGMVVTDTLLSSIINFITHRRGGVKIAGMQATSGR